MRVYKNMKFVAKLCMRLAVLALTNNLYSMHRLPHIIKKNIANLETAIRLLESDSSDEQEYEDDEEDENWLDNVSQELSRISGQLAHIAEQKQRGPLPHLTIDTSRDIGYSDKKHPRIKITKEEARELLGNPDPSSPTGSPQAKKAQAQKAKPLLHIPQVQWPNRNESDYQKPIIASMSPGKTGDICGTILMLYAGIKTNSHLCIREQP